MTDSYSTSDSESTPVSTASSSSNSLSNLKKSISIPDSERVNSATPTANPVEPSSNSESSISAFMKKHEIPRKVFHSSIGFLVLGLYTIGVQFEQVTPVLIALFILVLTTDLLRFNNSGFNQLYCKVMGPLMRKREEHDAFNGVMWYLLGLIIVFSIFPKDVSLVSVLLLSWADTAASTFGRAYGHLTPKLFGSKRKSLAGSIAAFVTGVVCATLIYQYFLPAYPEVNADSNIMWSPETSDIPFWLLALMSGFVGAISEAIDVYEIDDNITIPILSASFLWPIIKLGMKV